MRGKLLVGIVLVIIVFSLGGCGVKEKKEMKEIAVSESSDKMREKRKEEFLQYKMSENDTVLTKNCVYMMSDEDEDWFIIQKNRQGEEQNRFGLKTDKEYGSSLVAGSDKRLILAETREDQDLVEKEVYWQVPIQQTKEGETLLWEKREEIASGEAIEVVSPFDVYVVEPYMIFHDAKNIVRINLETGEQRRLTNEEDLSGATLSYFGQQDAGAIYMRNYPLAPEGEADAKHNRDILYRIDIETWEAEEVYAGEDEYSLSSLQAVSGSLMYLIYMTEDSDIADESEAKWSLDRIECYDREKKQSVGRCTRQDIEQLLDKEHLYGDEKKDRGVYISECFTYAERIYIVCSMSYNKDRKTDVWDEREVLLSCPMKDMSKISYEREVSEWWYENTYATENDEEAGARVVYGGNLIAGFENEVYFTYMDKEKKKWHLMRYDLKTKQQEEIGKKELEYMMFEQTLEEE